MIESDTLIEMHHPTFTKAIVEWVDEEEDPSLRYHPEGSPYRGLSLEQQKALAKLRRGGLKTPKWVTEKMRLPTQEDYDKIFNACAKAIVLGADIHVNRRLDRLNIEFRLAWNHTKYFPDDFPIGVILAYDDFTVVKRYNTTKVINWLYEHGKCAINSKELRRKIFAMQKEQEDFYFREIYGSEASIKEFFEGETENLKSSRGRKYNRVKNRIYRDGLPTIFLDKLSPEEREAVLKEYTRPTAAQIAAEKKMQKEIDKSSNL